MRSAAVLLLADGRLPSGGYAHSGGLEEAIAAGRVSGPDDLLAFLRGRLTTVGRVDAALAVAAWYRAPEWAGVDAEAAARCPAPAQRLASRAQGRGLLRAVRRMWPSTHLDALTSDLPGGPMWPVALGAVGSTSGMTPDEVAMAAAHAAVTAPAWAATRLLGADPFAVARCLADLVPTIDQEASDACRLGAEASAAGGPGLISLPAYSGPLLEIGAEAHAAWEVRLFAS